MTTKRDIELYICQQADNYNLESPIFKILLFDNPDKELIYENGVRSGYPDTGGMNEMGFYYDLDTAIQAMHENRCDIHETCFRAGFICCHFPGLYECSTTESRMFFLWDDEKNGFFEAEEPKIFAHMAY